MSYLAWLHGGYVSVWAGNLSQDCGSGSKRGIPNSTAYVWKGTGIVERHYNLISGQMGGFSMSGTVNDFGTVWYTNRFLSV